MNDPKKFINRMHQQGILVSKELLQQELDTRVLEQVSINEDLMVLTSDYVEIMHQPGSMVDWYEIDTYRVRWERVGDDALYQSALHQLRSVSLAVSSPAVQQRQQLGSLELELTQSMQANVPTLQQSAELVAGPDSLLLPGYSSLAPIPSVVPQHTPTIQVLISYQNPARKFEVKDFTNLFSSRFRYLEGILRQHQDLQSLLPIGRLSQRREHDTVSIIGSVSEISTTKNGNLLLTLEDFTGSIKVLVSKNNKELLQEAKDIVLDEVIGISGAPQEKILFANHLTWPDIPTGHELKKGSDDEYIIFLSDIHVGSALFLHEEFDRFLRWISGQAGNAAQQEMAAKVTHIFIVGDLVDGVGVYPSQEEELAIKDIRGQYAEFARLIRQIPQDKHIIMCPGNHDVVHLAEPQPVFYREYTEPLYQLPNATMVTNPALINIGRKEGFSGFEVQLYHGYSFDYYVANVESIRHGGGYHRADLIMKFLLKRRHLAPSFKSTPYFPGHEEDPLLIKKIPDFLATGHIHYSCVANYRGITMISGSCWQGKTSFQTKLGHEPEPGRVPVINLRTREVKVLKFT